MTTHMGYVEKRYLRGLLDEISSESDYSESSKSGNDLRQSSPTK